MIEDERGERFYMVRYGLMRRVGRFAGPDGLERGEAVVIRSHRGTELGEVLTEVSRPQDECSPAPLAPPPILRAAGPEDLERARRVGGERSDRFAACLRVFQDGVWPLELIDVEPLLDDRRTVLHYLGPHRLDASGVLAALRGACGLDGVLEPVGRDVPEADVEQEPPADSCGSHCGSGGCGAGGGCGADSDASGGCSDCGLKTLLRARRFAPAR